MEASPWAFKPVIILCLNRKSINKLKYYFTSGKIISWLIVFTLFFRISIDYLFSLCKNLVSVDIGKNKQVVIYYKQNTLKTCCHKCVLGYLVPLLCEKHRKTRKIFLGNNLSYGGTFLKYIRKLKKFSLSAKNG